ncbi:MAG: class I adenylate-forming enzyme family protein [Mycobacteriales bacterium]
MSSSEPAAPATIIGNLGRGRRLFGERPLLVTGGGQTTTYAEFAELVEGAAAHLAAEGMRPGDRLAVCARNGLDIAVAIWACARGGFVFAGLPTNLDATAWAALCDHVDPAVVLAGEEFLDSLGHGARPLAGELTGRRLPWDEQRPLPAAGDVYAVVFTSGTTGRPKAAMVTHQAAMTVAAFYRGLLGLTPADRTAIHLPFSYVSGHISQLNPFLLAGGAAVTMPRFSAAELLRVIAAHRISVLDVVPSIFALLLREPGFGTAATASLRAAYFGGAPMPPATIDALRDRQPALRLFNVYGMSETAGLITALPDEDLAAQPGSVGRPVAGAQVRIDADSGELLVRGPTVMPGYWNDPAATAAAVDGDGWLHTGDIARVDAGGYLRIVDRVTDMINRGGVKIYPADVEHALTSHPDVQSAAAVGLPDGMAGEAVAACVVLRPDAPTDLTEVRAHVRALLPVHARPRRLLSVEAIPRNATGKLDRTAVRDLLAGPAGPEAG